MSEAWQQEKEFLDYMFNSLHGGGAGGADETGTTTATTTMTAMATSATRRTGRISSSGSSTSNNNKSPVRTEFAPAGLDHLDNLCKLMEQLGELKDANSRLQKRIQYLEDMKTLQEMHQELDMQLDPSSSSPLLECKTGSTPEASADRSIDSLDSGEILCPATPSSQDTSKKSTGKSHHHHHHRAKKSGSIPYRERSKSVGFDDPAMAMTGKDSSSAAVASEYSSPPAEVVYSVKLPVIEPSTAASIQPVRTKTKVSKWTRVKEAFRWEKAHVDSSPGKLTGQHLKTPLDPAPSPTAVLAPPTTPSAPESPPSHVPVQSKSSQQSPVFLLSRRRMSASRSRTSSTSSSSLSECPLESEILKSFADAQELPLFRMDKRASSPEVKMVAMEESGNGSVLALHHQMKRLHRQSTISCDANFANTGNGPTQPGMPSRIPEGTQPEAPAAAAAAAAAETPSSNHKAGQQQAGPDSPSRRKGSSKVGMDPDPSLEGDESTSFMANLRSQLKPINEWTSKHFDLMKATSGLTASGNSEGLSPSSRNSVSVPSSPHQHQAFTFDEYPGGLEQGMLASRDNSPNRAGLNKKQQQQQPSEEASQHHLAPSSSSTSPTWMNSRAYNPGNLLNSISPEFRKKVEVWEKLKSGLTGTEGSGLTTTPPTPSTSSHHPHGPHKKSSEPSPDWSDISKRRSESDKLPPAFKKKLAEWEIRKAVAGKSDREVEELQKILPQDFNRKLQEWERMKAAAAAAAAAAASAATGNKSLQPVSPGLERQGSGKGGRSLSSGGGCASSGRSGGKNKSEERDKKEKDLQWLEKELQKIEREKMRLEREREKYIERESRLEKIREAMKHQPDGHGAQREICIRTSTGEFRFQGLSRKFTKKLFQWEEQKGIRPEASTIALLDGAYRPPGHCQHPHHHHLHGPVTGDCGVAPVRPTNLALIGRSKSESSVADLVCSSVHSQPSSLSLNNAESAADFDRRLAAMDQEAGAQTPAGPGALLVEVEDVMEESAAVVDIPEVRPQAPIYSIAPAQPRQTICESEPERTIQVNTGAVDREEVQRNESGRTEASYKLLEENLSLLDRLRAKGEIVKYLEQQMSSIDGDMAGVASTQTEEMDRLKEEETCLSDQEESCRGGGGGSAPTVERLKQRIIHLESRGQQLKAEKEQLQAVYNKQCGQQVLLVQHLVDKMQQLRELGSNFPPTPSFDEEALRRLDALTSELLREAQVLETSLMHPQRLADQPAGDVQQLSIKANQLKQEFERLRSFDSEADSEEEAKASAASPPIRMPPRPLPPPLLAEMSPEARKKIFVETHRLVFAPLADNLSLSQQSTPLEEDEDEEGDGDDQEENPSIHSWRYSTRSANEGAEGTSTPTTRKSSLPEENPTEFRSIRATAPNIRRMIDIYHQRVTGSGRERPPVPATLHFRLRCDSPAGRSESSTPPLTPLDATCPSPSTDESSTAEPGLLQQPQQQQPLQLCKSQSTGAMVTDGSKTAGPGGGQLNSGCILRSRSGIQIGTGQGASSSPTSLEGVQCARNPSFFRKSPLDPSIDDLLQKYRGRPHHAVQPVPDLPRSPTTFNPERAIRLKQAREAFLTIGPGAVQQVPITRLTPPTPSPPASPQPDGPDVVLQPCSETMDIGGMQPVSNLERTSSVSCPSSPGIRRPNVPPPVSPHPPSGRRSWLKQPTKFFFLSKPKTP